MEKTELDKGFEQALAALYLCRQCLLTAIEKDPESFKNYTANDYEDWLTEAI